MFLLPVPLDRVPRRAPVAVWALIAVNSAVFLWSRYAGDFDSVIAQWALVPAHASPATCLTSMFLHGGWLHIVGNMIFLSMFGGLVEDAIGSVFFVILYLAAGFSGALLHVAVEHGSLVPCVGASGAISGVLGAYAIFFPHDRTQLVVYLGWIRAGSFQTRALGAVLAWGAEQGILGLAAALFPVAGLLSVAFWAHVGGLAGGGALAFAMAAAGAVDARATAETAEGAGQLAPVRVPRIPAPRVPAGVRAKRLYAANVSFSDIGKRLAMEDYPVPASGNWDATEAERIVFSRGPGMTGGLPAVVHVRPRGTQLLFVFGGMALFALLMYAGESDKRSRTASRHKAEVAALPGYAGCLADAAILNDGSGSPERAEQDATQKIQDASRACRARFSTPSGYNERWEVHDSVQDGERRRSAHIRLIAMDPHEFPSIELTRTWRRAAAGRWEELSSVPPR